MKRPFMAIFLILLIVVSMAACGQANGNSSGDSGSSPAASQTERNTQENISEPAQTEASEATERKESVSQEQTECLEAIPAAYFEDSDQPGQVIQVTYESQDYTGDDTPITKPALVYLPYGYDENDTDTRYDILYLMHGWTMTAGDFLGAGRSNLVNILDNLIASGDIPPVIVVSATFDGENQAQSFSRSVEELSVFHNDLRENLMPYITDDTETIVLGCTHYPFLRPHLQEFLGDRPIRLIDGSLGTSMELKRRLKVKGLLREENRTGTVTIQNSSGSQAMIDRSYELLAMPF